jgi:miniconductance mechanosensitive channel
MIAMGILATDAFLNASLDIYKTYEVSNRIPIKGFIQVFKIIIYFTSAVFIISILLNKTPFYLFSSLGALTAVLMFIFKDAILGFVAGIQLSANQMVAQGDWIEMPKYGANGDIIEIALTTVKVQNWDKTITTVPTYALISESFKNWRGMSESGGRRIKRSISIDMNTIQFCTEDMLDRFSKIQYISGYIEEKKRALQESNELEQVDQSSLVNGRRMTNIGTFRAYVKAYLSNHPMINKEMTLLIRQLAPTEHGLPIEIYVFSKNQEWVSYESIQSNIFDHILAVVPEFDLRVFQDPSGMDFSKLTRYTAVEHMR